jgi:hypothetical protein
VVVHTMNCGWNRGGLPLIPGAVVEVVCLRWSSQESPCSWPCFHWGGARFARPWESMVSDPCQSTCKMTESLDVVNCSFSQQAVSGGNLMGGEGGVVLPASDIYGAGIHPHPCCARGWRCGKQEFERGRVSEVLLHA